MNNPESLTAVNFNTNQPNITTLTQTESQSSTEEADSLINSDNEIPKIIKVVSSLIFLIAILYVFRTINILGVMVVMNYALTAGALEFAFFRYFASWGLIPIILSLASLMFFYVSFKVRNGSTFGFWLGFSSLLIIPISVALINQALMAPYVNINSDANQETNYLTTKVLQGPSEINYENPILILTFISLILLLFSYNKFYFPNSSLSKKVRIFIVVMTLILLLPTTILLTIGYIKANDTDFGYSSARSQVTHHIYKPSSTLNELDFATKFTLGHELAGKQNAVRVAYDVPFDEMLETGKVKPVVVTQVGVEPNFNFEEFVAIFGKDKVPQKVYLSLAINNSGYLIQQPFGDSYLNTIILVTNDNILITIVSPKLSSDELIQFAEILE